MINRELDYEVLPEIVSRWSPRAFDAGKKVSDEDLMAIFEAARFAPSGFNEQPWRYLVSRDEETHAKILSCLAPTNQVWAKNAPVLAIILAKSTFDHNGKPNRWHLFDTGASWGFLSLEAIRRGLMTHAMGGVNVQLVKETFNIPEEYSVIVGLAIGYYGDKAALPEELQKREEPSPRDPLADLFYKA